MKKENRLEGILEDKYPGEYKIVGEYVNSTTKIPILHKSCGKVTSRTPKSVQKSKIGLCQYCIKGVFKDNEWFKFEVDRLAGSEYVVLTDYVKAKAPVKILHVACGYEWECFPDNFLSKGSRCPNCAGNARTDTEGFTKRLNEMYKGEYVTDDTYINARTKMTIKHTVCGNSWRIAPDTILNQGVGCPVCKESHGERLVRNILLDMGVDFTSQKTFEGCKLSKSLPFDFYIDSLKLCIEYDGIQHFEPVRYGGMSEQRAEDIFNKRVFIDNFKDKYCEDNGIHILRIPYYMSNEEIEKLIRSNAEQLTPKSKLMI